MEKLKIGVFFSPWSRTTLPTGVGRHAIEMTRRLAECKDVDLSLFATRADLKSTSHILSDEFGQQQTALLPVGDRMSRLLFTGLRCVGIDRWSEGADWVYCPKEQPVATAKARLAVNVHDTLVYEPRIDGMTTPTSLRSRLRWAHVMRQIRRADLITTVSEFTKQRLVDICQCEASRISVTGNGVSDIYFRDAQTADQAVLAKYGVQTHQYFIAVGSLTYRKGGDLILDAASLLRDSGYQVPVLLSGRRHDPELLSRHKSTTPTEHNPAVRLTGYIPDEDQAALLTHALAFIFPSRYEGFGIPALEAMAAGTVVVCSRIPALQEMAGENCLFIPPNDAGQLAKAMIAVINGDVERERFQRLGRLRANDYRWERCARRLVDAMGNHAG